MNAKGVKKRTGSEDEFLVRRVQKGDWDAFEILVLKYQERIFRVVRRFLGDREQVEDLAQEVFIRAYRSLGSFEGKSSFYTWLYKIALNTCRIIIAASEEGPKARLLTARQSLKNWQDEREDPRKMRFAPSSGTW